MLASNCVYSVLTTIKKGKQNYKYAALMDDEKRISIFKNLEGNNSIHYEFK